VADRERRNYRQHEPEPPSNGGQQQTGTQAHNSGAPAGNNQQQTGTREPRNWEYPLPGRSGGGGYQNQNQGRNQQGDGEFIMITGLFPSKSGTSDIAFVKKEIADKLNDIREGDTIGININKKSQRPQLWYIRKGE
jgi:hypothetical protein